MRGRLVCATLLVLLAGCSGSQLSGRGDSREATATRDGASPVVSTADDAGGSARDSGATGELRADGRLAIEREYTSRPGGWLEVSELDGRGRHLLTRPPRKGINRWDSDAAFSPDGSMVAFVRWVERPAYTERSSAVFVVNADGTGLRRIVGSDQVGRGIGDITWSKDGTALAFARSYECSRGRAKDVGLYVVNLDGLGLRRLPVLASYARPLRVVLDIDAWSSDGTRLLYHVVRYGYECRYSYERSSDLYAIGVNGEGRTRLARAKYMREAEWSPDEQSVVFTAFPEQAMGFGGDQCSLFHRDGGGKITLLVDLGYVVFGCGPVSFVWSNDGSEIAYSDGQKNIEAIGVETGQRRRVFAGNTSSLPCNETGDVTDESAPCEPIRILATSPDGGRILLDPADYERRPLPLALASFDGSSAIDLPVASSGVYGASVIASAVLR